MQTHENAGGETQVDTWSLPGRASRLIPVRRRRSYWCRCSFESQPGHPSR